MIALRIDDVQDYAFSKGHLYLLKYNTDRGIPTDLSIIPSLFGADYDLLCWVKLAIKANSEVSIHGWRHEDLSSLSLQEQVAVMSESKSTILKLLGINVTVIVPPMYKYNNLTLEAMLQTGFNTISSSLEIDDPGLTENGILKIPATVEFSDYVNGTWVDKGCTQLLNEAKLSVKSFGYAVIVIHPQELYINNELSRDKIETYEFMMRDLAQNYIFTSLKEIANSLNNELQ